MGCNVNEKAYGEINNRLPQSSHSSTTCEIAKYGLSIILLMAVIFSGYAV
jgi:hypothetical protein